MDDPRPNLDADTEGRISQEAGAELLECLAQKHFGIGAEEFSRRWHTGALRADEHPHAVEIAMLLPLGRP